MLSASNKEPLGFRRKFIFSHIHKFYSHVLDGNVLRKTPYFGVTKAKTGSSSIAKLMIMLCINKRYEKRIKILVAKFRLKVRLLVIALTYTLPVVFAYFCLQTWHSKVFEKCPLNITYK